MLMQFLIGQGYGAMMNMRNKIKRIKIAKKRLETRNVIEKIKTIKEKLINKNILINKDCEDAPNPEIRREYLLYNFKIMEDYLRQIEK